MTNALMTPTQLGSLPMENRFVMAPRTGAGCRDGCATLRPGRFRP
jgi:2,4-dienoyl-CoA reductase-like NADH-dependent reductase (Old Yellow Enzyme family)